MPEWLADITVSQVIAVLTSIGALAAWFVALRDKAHLGTVENLNSRISLLDEKISYLNLLLAEARRQVAEAEASDAKIREAKDLAERELAMARNMLLQYPGMDEERIDDFDGGAFHGRSFIPGNHGGGGEPQSEGE